MEAWPKANMYNPITLIRYTQPDYSCNFRLRSKNTLLHNFQEEAKDIFLLNEKINGSQIRSNLYEDFAKYHQNTKLLHVDVKK